MKTFALIDCNNFFASCEKLFRPDLKNTPVVVLSNNDGCVVARSAEAKALGIKMGVPYFKVRDELDRHGVVAFSSNYALYGDMSERVMKTVNTLSPRTEVYSIDEIFCDLDGIQNIEEYGHKIRARVQQWTGISVGVGIAPTKTLAKLANHAAKKYKSKNGVVVLNDRSHQKWLMQRTDVSDVWGVGRRLTEKLNAMRVYTAWDLAQLDTEFIRRKFSIVLARTVEELNGRNTLQLEEVSEPKKQIVSSKSFGQRVTRLQDMREAVSCYTATAAEKLRRENQLCSMLSIFIHTSRFTKTDYYHNYATAYFNDATNDTRDLIGQAQILLDRIWRDGYDYAKAGVMLSQFTDCRFYQPALLPHDDFKCDRRLMSVIDRINNHQRGNIFFASQGIKRPWQMQRERLSPCYTTNVNQLPKIST